MTQSASAANAPEGAAPAAFEFICRRLRFRPGIATKLAREPSAGNAITHGEIPGRDMEAFLISLSTVAIAEMGDRTQLLALVLAAHYRKPWPIIAGVVCATLVNHAVAGYVGAHLGRYLTASRLDLVVGVSMIGMALWTLKPDKLDEGDAKPRRAGAFVATCIAFFIAEIGDKTQIATMALGAAYSNLAAVVAGTTLGMLAANAPVVFLGHAFSKRLPLKAIHIAASLLFLALGALFIWRALARGI